MGSSSTRTGWWRIAAAAAAAVAAALAVGAVGHAAAAKHDLAPAFVGCWHRHTGAIAPLKTRAGALAVAFKVDGSVVVYRPPARVCKGRVALTTKVAFAGARAKIGKTRGCKSSGTYRWFLSGDSLILKPTADGKCALRAQVFTGVWLRK